MHLLDFLQQQELPFSTPLIAKTQIMTDKGMYFPKVLSDFKF